MKIKKGELYMEITTSGEVEVIFLGLKIKKQPFEKKFKIPIKCIEEEVARIKKSSKTKHNNTSNKDCYELMYCKRCNQMTNHKTNGIEYVCQKCSFS